MVVLVMTEIVLAHDKKHVRNHYFSVRSNASPKRTPDLINVIFFAFVRTLQCYRTIKK